MAAKYCYAVKCACLYIPKFNAQPLNFGNKISIFHSVAITSYIKLAKNTGGTSRTSAEQ